MTVCSYASGLPIAPTHSPTRSVSESPSGAYGSGRAALTTTHLETRAGAAHDDWLFWDDYDYTTGNPVTNPDNPWDVMKAIFTNWLVH